MHATGPLLRHRPRSDDGITTTVLLLFATLIGIGLIVIATLQSV